MQPYIRQYNYINDYFKTVYKIYGEHYIGYPVTYYALDKENTIWDNDKINSGSYEKLGVGSLSGVYWHKIYLLPVYMIEPIVPNQDSGERGLTYFESMVSQIIIPSTLGIKPLEWDAIDLNYGFLPKSPNTLPLYNITNINISHHGDQFNVYQCRVKVAPYSVNQINTQISSYWKFLDHEKKILPLDNTNFLLTLEDKNALLSTRLKSLMNNVGIYMT